jgi:putative ABC transport system permease protein
MRRLYPALSMSYWRRHRAQASLMVLSIGLGVATWMATRVLNQSLEKAGREAGAPIAGDADLYIGNGDAGVPRALAESLGRVPGVRAVQPLVIHRATLPELDHRPALMIGADLGAREIGGGWRVTVNELTPRLFVRSVVFRQKPVLIGRELAGALPPDASELSVLVAGQVHRLHCTGVIDGTGPGAALAGNVVVTDCDAAAALVGRPDRVSRLDVYLAPGTDRVDVQHRLEIELADRAHVSTPDGHDERVQEMLSGVKIGMTLCGAASLVIGVFLVYNTLSVSGIARRHEIGILRSVGATRWQVAALFLAEAAILGLAGTVLGIPLGLGLAHWSLGPVERAMSEVFLPLRADELPITAGSLASAAAAGLMTAMLAAVLPALRSCRDTPVEALRRTPPRQGIKRGLIMVNSLALASVGAACLWFRERLPGRVGTYGSLVLILLAALAAAPLLSAVISRLAQPLSQSLLGIAGRLAAGNLTRAPGRSAIVIATLAAGTALLLQTGGLVRSNESAVRTWIDQSLAGDLFVTSGGPLSASGQTLPMSDRVGNALMEMHPEIRAVPMRFRYLDWEHAGRTTRVLLTALDARAYYEANRDRQPPLPDLALYEALREPGTAVVSENFAALYGVRQGDAIVLRGSDGPITLRVLGAVADYSCNRGTVLIDRERYRGQLDADLVDVFDVYLPAGNDSEAVRQSLQRSSLAAEQSLSVLTHDELRGHILGMVGRLYGLAYTQEAVVAVVALLGVVAALLISVLQRRRELAILRALGATRGLVLRSVIAEGLLMGVVGTAIGLIIGIPLEWYTVRILLYEESGFLCPVLIPWMMAGTLVCLTFTGVAAAGLGPALRAARDNIVEAIAYE